MIYREGTPDICGCDGTGTCCGYVTLDTNQRITGIKRFSQRVIFEDGIEGDIEADTLGSATIGSSSTPIYLDEGSPVACSSLHAATADSATTASKLGSATLGSAIKPVFLNAGTATECNTMCDLGTAQNISGVKTFTASPIVPTTTTGASDTYAANGTRIQNDLDNYSPMVRTSGAQTIAGSKTLTDELFIQRSNDYAGTLTIKHLNDIYNTQPSGTVTYPRITWTDKNGATVGVLFIEHTSSNTFKMKARIRNSDGTYTTSDVLTGS